MLMIQTTSVDQTAVNRSRPYIQFFWGLCNTPEIHNLIEPCFTKFRGGHASITKWSSFTPPPPLYLKTGVQLTRDVTPRLLQCWSNVYDAGPTSKPHCLNVSYLQAALMCDSANTRHLTNVVLVLAHRLRRWTNNKQALIECLVCAGRETFYLGWVNVGPPSTTLGQL